MILTVTVDLLDEFSSTNVDKLPDAQDSLAAPTVKPPDDDEDSNAAALEFSKQLQEQMAALLGSVDETPEMRKEIEVMMQELGATTDSGQPEPAGIETEGTKTQASAPSGEDRFQTTIRKTMERMQTSGEQASAAAASDDTDDILERMLKEMHSGGLDGAGGEEDFSKMLMSMMEQLTNKEILYEPMKELHNKFPEWMNKNRNSVTQDNLRRYEDQQRLVREIVAKFDEKAYSDSKAADRQYIVERMQQVSQPRTLVLSTC